MTTWIERFEAFARSKPADERYDFWDVYECPVAQFARHSNVIQDDQTFADSLAMSEMHFESTHSLYRKPWAFGALADRLSALIEDEGE